MSFQRYFPPKFPRCVQRSARRASLAATCVLAMTCGIAKAQQEDAAAPARTTSQPAHAGKARESGCAAEERALSTAQGEERIPALLDAARCLIVEEAASAVSAALHRTSGEGVAAESKALDRARALLREADALLSRNQPGRGEEKTDSDDENDARDRRHRARHEMLIAFAAGFEALLAADGTAAAASRSVDAAVDLAPYVDDPSAGVAASARLWQAVLYRRAGRADRALRLLPIGLEPTEPRRIEFLMRLERCRALADEGRLVAALALAARLGTRAEAWLASESPDARRGAAEDVRRLRAYLYRRWATQLRAEQALDRAAEAEATARTILPADDASTVRLLLEETIADLAPLSRDDEHQTASRPATAASQPATRRSAEPETE